MDDWGWTCIGCCYQAEVIDKLVQFFTKDAKGVGAKFGLRPFLKKTACFGLFVSEDDFCVDDVRFLPMVNLDLRLTRRLFEY